MLQNVRAVSTTKLQSNQKKLRRFKKLILVNWQLYLLLVPVVIYFLLFKYLPILGLQIGFKEYSISRGIWGSPWVGFENFQRFFNSFFFKRLIFNTVGINLYNLIVGFPIPIILALMLNEVTNTKFKKLVQTVTYAPYFISFVVLGAMLIAFLSPNTGIVNNVIKAFGGSPISFMNEPQYFKHLYVLSDIWQNAGWSAIIYIAALSGIDGEQHEAALIDGATKLQRIRYINIPGILPTIIILFILAIGRTMGDNFEKIFIMQNELNRASSDVISTFVYRTAFVEGMDISFSAAIGLFNSTINFLLLVIVNGFSKKISNSSLW